MQVLVSAFLAILFLQSGIDKVVDRRGNLEWLKGHFAKSPLAKIVTLMLDAITVLELAAGALSAIGCALIVLWRDSTIAFLRRGRFRDFDPGVVLRTASGKGICWSGCAR